jgi:hypothetical protein
MNVGVYILFITSANPENINNKRVKFLVWSYFTSLFGVVLFPYLAGFYFRIWKIQLKMMVYNLGNLTK